MPSIRVGCAGWSIPTAHRPHFPTDGTHLARYATVLPAVQINSSFYRPHRQTTYEAWARAVPTWFQFSVKMPRQITHEERLSPTPRLKEFLRGPAALAEHLGPLLIQLPPTLALAPRGAQAFFAALRSAFAGTVVCEPRHSSWFSPEAQRLLVDFEIARVAADPPPVPGAADPGGWRGISYFRLHGSPGKYRSSYPEAFLSQLLTRLRQEAPGRPAWVIFDNTASGAAIGNAIWMLQQVGLGPAK